MKTERVIRLLEVEKLYALKQRGFQQKPINKEVRQALDIAINAVGAIEQLRWERDTVVNHGEWQHRKAKETDIAKWYLCSRCNGRAYSDGYTFELSKYCPHCGAKMDGDGGLDNG